MTQITLGVANFFIGKSLESGIELTPMKLLKLVYIAHGWHLALYDGPLIGEAVEAWQYGPVVRSVYDDFKSYRSSQILRQGILREGGNAIIPIIGDDEAARFLDSVWNEYKKYDGLQLSTLTHKKGTPWDRTYNKSGNSKGAFDVIPETVIKEYYVEMEAKAAQRQRGNTVA